MFLEPCWIESANVARRGDEIRIDRFGQYRENVNWYRQRLPIWTVQRRAEIQDRVQSTSSFRWSFSPSLGPCFLVYLAQLLAGHSGRPSGRSSGREIRNYPRAIDGREGRLLVLFHILVAIHTQARSIGWFKTLVEKITQFLCWLHPLYLARRFYQILRISTEPNRTIHALIQTI